MQGACPRVFRVCGQWRSEPGPGRGQGAEWYLVEASYRVETGCQLAAQCRVGPLGALGGRVLATPPGEASGLALRVLTMGLALM